MQRQRSRRPEQDHSASGGSRSDQKAVTNRKWDYLGGAASTPAAPSGEVVVGGPFGVILWRSRLLQLSECLLLRSPEDRFAGFAGFAGGLFAAAVVGGVVGPVSAVGPLPGDGDADVDAEQSGESRRCLGGLCPHAQPVTSRHYLWHTPVVTSSPSRFCWLIDCLIDVVISTSRARPRVPADLSQPRRVSLFGRS